MRPEQAEQVLKSEVNNIASSLDQLKSSNYKDRSEALGTLTSMITNTNSFNNEQRKLLVPLIIVLKKRTSDFKDGNFVIIKAINTL